MTGKIKKIVADRAFGFIQVEGREKDLFFHKENVVGVQFEDLKEGATVTFDESSGPKGPFASNIQLAE